MNTATLQIAIEVDDQGSVKIRRLGRTVEETGRKGERSFRAMGRTLGDFDTRVGRTLGSISSLYSAIASAVAVTALAKVSAAAVRAASDLQEVSSKFDVVFNGQQQEAEQWSRTLVDSYAMSTRESKQYLASVQDLLVPMGMASDQAGEMSFAITTLAADLGSFNNLPTAQVMDDIHSALVGNYETMKKYGVVLSAATVQQKALSMGLADSARDLTAADKAMAAYRLMVEGSTAAIGDMERTSGSYANQLKEMHARVEDMQAAFGAGLLPVMTDLLQDFNDWYSVNSDLLQQDLRQWATLMAESVRTIAKAAHWTLQRLQALDEWLSGKGHGSVSDQWADQQIQKIEALQAAIDSIRKSNQPGKETYLAGMEQQLDLLMAQMDVFQNDNSAAILAMEDAGRTAEMTAGSISSIGAAAAGSAATACQANRQQLSCAQKALQKEVDAAVAAGRQMKDLWQVQAEDKYKILSRSYQAQIDMEEETNDAINADLEQLMTDRKELWQGGNDEIATLQENLVNDLGRTLDSYISDVLRGEIDTIGDLFEGLFNSILDMFARTLSQIAANSIIDAIFGAGASGAGGLTIQGLLGGGGGLLGTAASGASLASGASTVAGWLGMGGGSAAAAGGAAAVGGAGFGITQAGSAAAGYGATATGAITDFSIDAAGGSAGLASGAGIGAALGTAAAIAAVPVALNLLGSLFDREHPAWDIPTSSGRNLQVTKVTDDPLADVHKALERTALSAGDAAMKVDRYTDALHDSEYASEYAEEAAADFQAQIDDAWRLVEYLGNDVGEAWAAAALRIDGSITSIDTFVDTAAGFDVAMTTSASMWDLATQAARGNAEALGALEGKFRDLGLGAAAADQATMAMVGAVNKLSHTSLDMEATAKLNVEVHGDASASASVTGSSSVSSGDFGWWRHAGDHALGAIFTAPTLLAGPDGLHRVAEAGMAEAVLPLPAGPRTMQLVLDSLEALLARQAAPGRIEVHVNLAGEKVGQVLLPMIDRHIDARQSRGVSGRVVYAAG